MFSKFFKEKLEAIDRFKNSTEFNYVMYPKSVIKYYLDFMHGIQADVSTTQDLLQLLHFLRFEGKAGVYIVDSLFE